MRPDIGISTIPQRLAGLTGRGGAVRPPAAGPAGVASFADALAQQVQSQVGAGVASAVGQPALRSTSGAGTFGAGTFGAGTFGAVPAFGSVPALGPGVSLRSGPSAITPQFGGAGVGGVGAYGASGVVGHACPECTPAAVGVVPGGAGGLSLDRSGPPPELQGYGNGQIPLGALESLGVGDHRLWAPAARAFRDLSAAAARDGVRIDVNSSYRDTAQQQQMVDRYGLYSQGGRAAAPGSSNHGWGVSLDLGLDEQAKAWMREHAADYGFVEDVPREPWHWTFTASGY